MSRQPSLWEGERLPLDRSIELTIESLNVYGPSYRHWVIAFSGGKDSTLVSTLVPHLIATGHVPPPERLTVMYADTGLEVPPLHLAAMETLARLEETGIQTRVVRPDLDKRFFVYMLGRGVPPPNNHFRWCTPKLKVEPMNKVAQAARDQLGEKFLLLTGVREGESAARNQRIVLSCSKNGSECGQGWFQHKTPTSVADILAPIIHWRVCHVWDWLTFHVPEQFSASTRIVAEVYGGNEAQETNARTGCMGCPLVGEDHMMEYVISLPRYAYLAPVQRLRPLYEWLRLPENRLRKDGTQRRKDGKEVANPLRMGPILLEIRLSALQQVLAIQAEVNAQAQRLGRPEISLINEQEYVRIVELIGAQTWPQTWTGEEEHADVLLQREAEAQKQREQEAYKYSLWALSQVSP